LGVGEVFAQLGVRGISAAVCRATVWLAHAASSKRQCRLGLKSDSQDPQRCRAANGAGRGM